MASLDLVPRTLDLKLYEGDDPVIALTFYEDETKTTLLPLTGYTAWAATIRTPAGATAAWTVDASQQALSVISLQLDGDDIRGFPAKGCRWDFKALDASSREVTWYRGRVTVATDVTT